MTINAVDDASFSYSAFSYCADASDPTPTITGLSGGAFSSTAGLSISGSTGQIDVSASTPGTYTVTYATAGTCPNSATTSVTINSLDDASFSYSASSYCADATDPTPTITGLTGGAFSSTAGLSISGSTGQIDVSASTPGTYTVTYTTAGTCPNSATTSVTINALDDASFGYGASSYCPLDADPTPTITGLAGGSFSSTAGLSISSAGQIDVSASTLGTYTVTYTTAGTCPNSSNVTVTIANNVTAVCQDVTVQLDANGNGSISTSDVNNGSSASCGIASMSLSENSFDCSDVGANTVTLTVTSASGATNTCTATVTVEDNIAPTAVCQDVTIQLDASGAATLTTTQVNNVSSDACGIASIALSKTSFACSDVGSNTVTLTVTDVNGNTSTCTSTITVEDNIAPTAVCQDVTIQLDASGAATLTTTQVNNGSSDACGIASIGLSKTSFACSDVGSNTVTLAVTDVNGNTSTCTSTITVEDNVDPTAVCQDVTIQLDASGAATLTTTQVNNGSSDACGIASIALSKTSFACSDVGTNTVTLTVTDVNGNSSTCTSTVTVEDNIAPTAICQDVTIQLDASGSATLTTTQVNNGSSDACGVASISLSKMDFDCNDIEGQLAPVSEVIDQPIGGTASSAISNWQSFTPDEKFVLRSIDLAQANPQGNLGSATLYLQLYEGEGVGGTLLASATNTVTMSPGFGTSTQTYNFNNVVLSAGQTYSWRAYTDIAPVYTWISFSSFGASTYTGGISSVNPVEDFVFQINGSLYRNPVTLTVTDVNGNSSICAGSIKVEDNVAPSAVCQDVTIQLDASGNASISTSDVNNGSSDACGIASMSLSQTDFDCSEVGANTVTLTVTDVNGNSSTCTSTVTVEDNIDPTAICQDVTIQLNASGAATLNTTQVDNGSIDICGIANMSLSKTSFDCSEVGANPVTLTVTDNNGNVSTCSATITVEDNVVPVAVCQDFQVILPLNGSYTLSVDDIDNGSSDACGIATRVISQTAFTDAHLGTNVITLTVTDNNGNVNTCTSNFTLIASPPTAVCQDVTVYLNAAGQYNMAPSTIDNGSSSPYGAPLTSTISKTGFSCSDLGPNTVTLTVTDAYNQTDACTSTVTVLDTVSPTAQCQNITLQLDATGNGMISVSDIDNGSSDACGIATMSLSNTSFSCADVGANTVTLTVTDNSGNMSTCSATVTVEDMVAPVAICQDVTVQLDATGAASITTADIDNGSSDACGVASIGLSQTSFGCSDVGANTVTLTVTDINGNVSTCMATVTVEDNIAPQALCQDVTLQLDASGGVTLSASQVDNGSNDVCGIASLSIDKTSFDCTDIGATTVTLTATDNNGNTSTCTSTITVEDNVSPVLVCKPMTYSLSGGTVTIDVNDLVQTASDNCGIASLTTNLNTFDCTQLGTFSVQVTATDVNGNTSQCFSSVTIVDNGSPTVVCQNVTVLLDANGNASITAAMIDNGSVASCGGTLTFALSQTQFTCQDLGTNTVTLTATGSNGNSASCSATVTVVDQTAPTMLCQNVTLQLDASGQASITTADVDNGSSDLCGPVVLSLSKTSFDCSDVGTNQVTLTGTDGSGNTSSCVATITVVDGIAPMITCTNPTVTLNANGSVSISASQLATATDNCGTVSISASQTTFTCSDVGSVNVVLTATDASGNSSSCTSTVTVTDNSSPNLTCQDVTLNLDANGQASLSLSDVVVNSGANCGVVSTTLSQTSFDCSDVGANTVTVTLVASNGQTQTCTSTVTVVDNMAPTVVCQAANIYLDAAGLPVLTVTDLGLIFSDNCGVTDINYDISNIDCDNVGVQNLPIVLSDAAGNSTTCNSQVTVLDTISPTIQCQDVSVNLDANGQAAITVSDALVSGSDNCSGTTYALSQTTFDCSDIGLNQVTLTATDANGNVSSCDLIVTVSDQQGPTLTCQPATYSIGTSGLVSVLQADLVASLSDNCTTSPSVSISPSTFSCADLGVNTVTITATDGSGNVSTCTTTVTVVDQTAPTISCVANIVVNNDPGQCGAVVSFATPTATDGCSAATLSTPLGQLGSGSLFPIGVTTLNFEAQDASGNSSTCSFTVTVIDSEAPVIMCPADINTPSAFGQTSVVVNYTMPSFTDNCSGAVMTQTAGIASGDPFPVGITTNSFTVTDGAGNSAVCSFDVIVTDPWAPQVNCPSNISVNTSAGQCSALVSFADPTVLSGSQGTITITRLDNTGLNSGDAFPVGTTNIQWEINRSAGPYSNSSFCSMNITVVDNENPVLSCPANLTLSNDPGQCGAVVNYTVPTVTDNCAGATASLFNGPASGSTFPVGTTVVTYQAVDASGNTAQCTFTVTVEDNEAPAIACPADIVVSTTGGSCAASVNYSLPTVSDNCPGSISLQRTAGNNSGATFPVGVTTVTYEATDAAGNTSTCSFTVTVNSSLTVDLGADITQCTAATIVPSAPSGATYTWNTGATSPTLNVTQSGTYTVTLTWPGGCTATDDINVTITGLPAVSFSGLLPFYCLDSAAATLVGVPAGGTFSGPGVSGNTFDPGPSGSGTFTVFYNYTDANGCSASAQQQVTVLSCTDIGIEENREVDVTLYPNPTGSTATIEWEMSVPSDVEIRVVNTLGQEVYNAQQSSNEPASHQLDVRQWAAGTYHVLLQHSNGVSQKRLIIQR